MNKKNRGIGVLLIVLTSCVATPYAHSEIPITSIRAGSKPPSGPKAACRIEVDSAHISTSIQNKHHKKAVKVDARSVCNFLQKNVDLKVELFKQGSIKDVLVTESETNPALKSSSGLIVTNYMTSADCVSSRLTTYYGVANARALIDGIIQVTSKVQSSLRIAIPCGT